MIGRVRRAVTRLIEIVESARVDRYAPMLVDRADAASRTDTLRLDAASRAALTDLREKGLAVLAGNVPPELCDAVLDDFRRHCADHPEHEQYRDELGLHDRLACLHMTSANAMKIGLNERVLEIVDAAFERRGAIVGSLFFERGSEQDIHRDTPAFFTVPLNHFFGVWTALEDIHPDSGQLRYYAGGHRAMSDKEFIGTGIENMEKYFSEVVEACRRRGCELVNVSARKGDTVIWHPQLPHGGGPIKDRRLSRRSIVFHYVPEGAPCYGASSFFGKERAVSHRNHSPYLRAGDRRYFDQAAPRFFHNRKEGNFKAEKM